MATEKLQFVDLDKIHWEKRFREDLGGIDELAESIKEKGVIQPVTVTTDFTLVAGERRVTAARKAGLKKIPALIRPGEGTEVDMREVELIENVFRKDFRWDERAKLVAEIDRLCKENKTEWSTRKTAQLLGHSHPMSVVRDLKLADAVSHFPGLAECKDQAEALKVVKKIEEGLITTELRNRQIQTKDRGLADMLGIANGNYNIGDALVEMTSLRSEGMVNFIEVDPPYGIDLVEQKKQTDSTNIVQTYKEVRGVDYQAFVETVAEETYRVAYKNAWMIFWFGPTQQVIVYNALKKAGWKIDDIPAIWSKRIGQTNAVEHYLARTYEPFYVCSKGAPILVKRGRSNVFDFLPIVGTKKYHPTERPIQLMIEILETFCMPNSIVLSPFLGSGVTLRACYLSGMRGFGYDLNPEYKDKFLLAVEEDTKKLNSNEEEK